MSRLTNGAHAAAYAALAWIALTSAAVGGQFHGINAGAPVWNGSVLLTSQFAQTLAQTGTRSLRVNFRLDNGATSWNANQLNMYDQVIANARNAGLEVLGLFSNETTTGGQVSWNNDPDGDGLNSYVTQFASNARLLADRYKADVNRWEVWNEANAWTNPNFASDPQNAGGTYILPRVYAQLLSETYRQLDQANLFDQHGASLVSGGLFAHDIGGSFSTAMPYLQEVYDQTNTWNTFEQQTGRRYPWDELGYHFYISQGSLVPNSQLASYFSAVRSTQAANNDSADVVVTEFGWQRVGSNTQELQRDNMARAYDFLESQPYVSGTYWYQWSDDVTGAWGLVDGTGNPRLSYHEFVSRNAANPSGQIELTTEHATTDAALSNSYNNSDLLQGRIATERPGDLGWHSANPASTNSSNPNGLAAFTDGVGDLGSGVTGLLNDFPASGAPAKLLEYNLGAAHDIDEIRIFTGNNGADGRIFSTTAVYTSTDGVAFDLLEYFQSDPSGATNNASTPGGANQATLVTVTRDDGTPLAEDITHLRFDFFAVSDLAGVMRDPFDGVNPFTSIDDGLTPAFVSPLVREIDVFGVLSTVVPGDYNRDGAVDDDDYLTWKANFGSTSNLAADGNGNGVVDAADYAFWRDHCSNSAGASTAVPEPAALILLLIAATKIAAAVGSRRS